MTTLFFLLIILIAPSYSIKQIYVLAIIFLALLIFSKYINFRNWVLTNLQIVKNYLKATLFFFALIIIGITFQIDYTHAFKNILTMSTIFMFLLFAFHCLAKTKKDEEYILLSLKIFSGVFILMSIMLYNTFKDAIILENEIHKLKIETAKENKNLLIANYNEFLNNQLKIFLPEEIDSRSIKPDKEEIELQIFVNSASLVIIYTIIYCFILLINNTSIFEYKVRYKKNQKYEKWPLF